MKTPICYLAHPVDFRADNQPQNTDQVRLHLNRAGFLVYSPARAFSGSHVADTGPNPNLQRINYDALARCDALVAMYPEDKTIGTNLELQLALSAGLPVLVISRVLGRSWILAELAERPNVRVVRYPGNDQFDGYGWLFQQVAAREDRPAFPEPLLFRTERFEVLPTRAYAGDAGFDLYVAEDWDIPPGQTVDVPCGVNVQLPDRVWGLILGRSSTLRNHNLLVNPGVIDTGWRGPLFVNVKNLGETSFAAKRGTRLGQLIPLPNLASGLAPISVSELSPSDRGESGFGSSGD